MEFINSLPTTRNQSQKPFAIAIRKEYGNDITRLLKLYPPTYKVQNYCADDNALKVAMEKELPTFGQLITTYGVENIASLLQPHVLDAIIVLGAEKNPDKIDTYDVRYIATYLCANNTLRLLHFPSVIAFFFKLKAREYKLYGVSTQSILDAAQEYAIDAKRKEERIFKEIEHDRQAKENNRSNAVTWEEFARLNNIPEQSAAEHFLNNLNKQRSAL